jgi:2-polyprenyl-3-methyl-5-hydroxy-6-metoxy-1,4-benzoquinol methylase
MTLVDIESKSGSIDRSSDTDRSSAIDRSSDSDRSNGWEDVAAEFLAVRSRIGVATVRTWARSLAPGAAVLDLGCGSGVPISEALMADGFDVHGVDASPSLVAAFHQRFPHAPVACEQAEESAFFGRGFDGAVAIGLMFLLPASPQRDLIRRVASALKPSGQFLFTAPEQECRWADALTGRASLSLGAAAYHETLTAAGLTVVGTYVDEGENYYYAAVRS